MQYMDMGWLTFTPPYEQVLLNYQAQPLLDSLYRNDNIYLMTVPMMADRISQFIADHQGVVVEAHSLYQMPSSAAGTPYELVQLYKLQLKH
jgi:hypothetical protein